MPNSKVTFDSKNPLAMFALPPAAQRLMDAMAEADTPEQRDGMKNFMLHCAAAKEAQSHKVQSAAMHERLEFLIEQDAFNRIERDEMARLSARAKWEAAQAPPAAPATDTAAPAPVVASAYSTPEKERRDVLTPAIETAQKECQDPFDAPAVWVVLVRMAGAGGVAPLLGVSDDGIKWLNSNDEPRFLTLKNLRERLKRKKKRAKTR